MKKPKYKLGQVVFLCGENDICVIETTIISVSHPLIDACDPSYYVAGVSCALYEWNIFATFKAAKKKSGR